MRYIFDCLKFTRIKNFNRLNHSYRLNFNNHGLNYRRFYSTTSNEPPVSEKKNLFWWQFRIFSIVGFVLGSSYLVYVFVTNDYDFNRSKMRLLVNWNSLFYGNTLSQRYKALINSRFNTCLSKELNTELCKYFLNIDLKKENGFRRSDALFFLSEVGIEEKNKIVDKFVSKGLGESRDHKLLSGSSLLEFALLVESLVIEERLKSNDNFENNLLEKLKELNSTNDIELNLPVNYFMMSNPLITGTAKKMSEEVAEYNRQHEHLDALPELEAELDRNLKLKKKLEKISKTRRLTEEEKRRLNNINEEIMIINEELSKHKHTWRKLLLM